jgi:chaperonin GroES
MEVKNMKLKPLADRVVLKQNAAEERTASGIFLTSSAQEKPEVYEVVEVGPGGMVDGNEVVMIVAPGQSVLVGKYTGTKVKLEDVEYTIVRQSDILAVLE